MSSWEPKSQFIISETRVLSARYPIIDMHTHDYGGTPEGVREWVAVMDSVDVQTSVVLAMSAREKFDRVVELYRPYGDRFQLWCGLDYTGYDEPGWSEKAVAELERCARMGATGVGELGDKGAGMWGGPVRGEHPDELKVPHDTWASPRSPYIAVGLHPDDPKLEPVFSKCADLGLPVSLHVADPIWMYRPLDNHNEAIWGAIDWQVVVEPGMRGHDGMIETISRTCRQNPRTTFVACHNVNLSHDLGRLGRLLDRHPNLYADISARFNLLAATPRQSARYITRYQDRFVYGTDMGRNCDMYRLTLRILESDDEHFYQRGTLWALHGLGLAPEVLKKLYRDNARVILDL